MKKFMMSCTDEMYKFLEKEMQERSVDTIQETVRQIISDHKITKQKK
jgi:hypothetical protein